MGALLARPTTRASYHYGISTDGRIGLFVQERDRCWGSSSGANDHQAIVIGVANNTGAPTWGVSDRAFESLINLCVDICQRNPGIIQIDGLPGLTYDGTPNGSLTRHNFFSSTLCPGPFLQSRFPEIVRLVNARLAPPEQPQAPADICDGDGVPRIRPGHEPATWATESWLWAMEHLNMDGTRPRDQITRQEVMTLLHRFYNFLQKP